LASLSGAIRFVTWHPPHLQWAIDRNAWESGRRKKRESCDTFLHPFAPSLLHSLAACPTCRGCPTDPRPRWHLVRAGSPGVGHVVYSSPAS